LSTPKSHRIPDRFRSFSTPDELSTSDEVSPNNQCLSPIIHDVTSSLYDASPDINDTGQISCERSDGSDVKFQFPNAFSFQDPDGTNVTWKLTRRKSIDLSYTQRRVDHVDRLANDEMRHVVYLDERKDQTDLDASDNNTGVSATSHKAGYLALGGTYPMSSYVRIGRTQSTL
jgi:hypothetical protein